MFNLGKIIGLSVVAIKGEYNAKGKNIEPKYILFSDGKTYLELEEQDYYSYHDCSSSARLIRVWDAKSEYFSSNPDRWEQLMSYKDATEDI